MLIFALFSLLIFRFRFTSAKVQHLGIPFPIFSAFRLVCECRIKTKMLHISLKISNFVIGKKICRFMKTKREIATLYFPNITEKSASEKLSTWIKNCKPLMKKLAKTGYKDGAHTLSDRQILMIYDYLGEP